MIDKISPINSNTKNQTIAQANISRILIFYLFLIIKNIKKLYNTHISPINEKSNIKASINFKDFPHS